MLVEVRLQGPFQRKWFFVQKAGSFVELRFQALFPSKVVVLPPINTSVSVLKKRVRLQGPLQHKCFQVESLKRK